MGKQAILFHHLRTPVPYKPALALQQRIHELQLTRRREGKHHPDVLLLLQHRPVYTGGRRQHVDELGAEQARLQRLGADWIPTARGGETTYHGPGQIVAYPLFDLGRMSVSVIHNHVYPRSDLNARPTVVCSRLYMLSATSHEIVSCRARHCNTISLVWAGMGVCTSRQCY